MSFSFAKRELDFIERMVRARRFNNRNAVVREALRRLEREENDYLRPPPISAAEARRVYRRDADWESIERRVAGRAKPE